VPANQARGVPGIGLFRLGGYLTGGGSISWCIRAQLPRESVRFRVDAPAVVGMQSSRRRQHLAHELLDGQVRVRDR
jgi:hypothetical protein